MRDGRIEQLGSAGDLYDQPVNAFVAGFIGESNLLAAKVISLKDGEARIDIEAFAQTATVPAASGLEVGDGGLLLIRPEHVLIDREPDGMRATITEVVYLGELTAFNLRLASGATLWGRQITDRSLKRGMSVKASWKRASARIVPKD
jgi:ABC-type Fe3+/spermidine/putrescine transport system ATPase subunit